MRRQIWLPWQAIRNGQFLQSSLTLLIPTEGGVGEEGAPTIEKVHSIVYTPPRADIPAATVAHRQAIA